jgi:hypothetical protein
MEVYLEDLLPLCKPLTKEQLKEKLVDETFKQNLAKAYALKHLGNGEAIRIGGFTYRNENLYFWDAQNQEIVEPFTEIDDYGSVPPRFVVGDGYFNPSDWLSEVEHNSYVFPARPLINEMNHFAEKNPTKKRMSVEINGTKYTVCYDPTQMKGLWDSCILEASERVLEVFPGDPSWRETIVDEPSSPEPALAPAVAAATVAAEPALDSVVTAVLDSFKARAATGQKKYGTNLDRTDLKTLDWIQHMQEELMDATLYLEKLKREFSHIQYKS